MDILKRILKIKVKSKETATANPELERAVLPKIEMRTIRGDQ
jgi:negative regulator of replication initiation